MIDLSMNVEIGTEAAQFPEKEYRNGIFVAVWLAERSLKQKFLIKPSFYNLIP